MVKDPKLTPDDVRVAFEEICEKLRVDGVDLEVLRHERAALWAVFRQAPLRREVGAAADERGREASSRGS